MFAARLCVLVVVALQLLGVLATSPTCKTRRIRKEVRDLQPSEWAAFTGAVNQLKRSGRYDNYVQTHITYTQQAHGGAQFFAWHRRFIYDFETEVLAITGSALSGIPYFDPLSTFGIFDPTSSVYVGTSSGCVSDGPFAGWTATDGTCLTRALTSSTTFVDPRILAQLIMAEVPYQQFETAYENGQHADVHTAIGGHMSSLNESPNDPLFYMHHSHVDYVWYKRQWFDVSHLYWDYQGIHTPANIGTVTLQTQIQPWGDNIASIADAYRIMCYDYQDPSGAMRRRMKRNLDDEVAANLGLAVNHTGPIFDFDPTKPIPTVVMVSDDALKRLNMDKQAASDAVQFLNQIAAKLNQQFNAGQHLPTIMDLTRDSSQPAPNMFGSGINTATTAVSSGSEASPHSLAQGVIFMTGLCAVVAMLL